MVNVGCEVCIPIAKDQKDLANINILKTVYLKFGGAEAAGNVPCACEMCDKGLRGYRNDVQRNSIR